MINFSMLWGEIVDKCIHLCSLWLMYANTLENFMKIKRSDLGSDPRHNIQTIKVSAKIETQFIFIPGARGTEQIPVIVTVVSRALTIILFTLDQFLYPGKCFSRHQSSPSVFTRTFYFILWTNDTSSVIRNIKLCLGPLSLFSLKLSPSSAMNGDEKDKKNISCDSNDYLNEIMASQSLGRG